MSTRTIDGWLETHAIHQPSKTALIFADQTCSYRDLRSWSLGLAGWLYDQGLRRGDRLALYGHNSAHQVALFFAAARLGAMVVPLNWRLSPAELGYILEDCAPKLLVYGTSLSDTAPGLWPMAMPEADLGVSETVPPDAALSDPYLIVYTSGTTGRPKGAVHTQDSVFGTR